MIECSAGSTSEHCTKPKVPPQCRNVFSLSPGVSEFEIPL